MITAKAITREEYDARSSGDRRARVDAYFVEYECPTDKFNPEPHVWVCRFEVPRKSFGNFRMRDFANKAAAIASRGF